MISFSAAWFECEGYYVKEQRKHLEKKKISWDICGTREYDRDYQSGEREQEDVGQ